MKEMPAHFLLLLGAILWIIAGMLSQGVYLSLKERFAIVILERVGIVVMLAAALLWIEDVVRERG